MKIFYISSNLFSNRNKMPKVKSEKRSEAHQDDGEKKSSGWGAGGQLFGTESTETTFQGAGFKDKEKAQETLRLLEGRDISFQFQIINSMFHRAKVILRRTNNEEKKQNLSEAIGVFEAWLDDYRAHSRSKENFSYLPLDVIEAYERLAKKYDIKLIENGTPSFLEVYKAADGDLKKLRVLKVNKEDENSITWDVRRNDNLKAISQRIKAEHMPLYETDVEFRGLPSREHVELIMWGYSPELTKIKKALKILDEKFKDESQANSSSENEESENATGNNGESTTEEMPVD